VQQWAGLVAGEDLIPKDWMKEIHQILIPFPAITEFRLIIDEIILHSNSMTIN
jgi:hypothetical protein